MSVWSDIAETVGQAAPMVGGLLAGPAGSSAGRLVASALGVENSPDAVQTALDNDPKWKVKLKALEQEHQRELRRMSLEAETARLAEINATMRAEAKAEDAYVRRWRPTFGYIAALSMAALMGGIVYVMVAEPQYTAEIVRAVAAVQPLLAMMLAVLGVNIDRRSRDKQVQKGQRPDSGILGAIAERVRGGGQGGASGGGGASAGEAGR